MAEVRGSSPIKSTSKTCACAGKTQRRAEGSLAPKFAFDSKLPTLNQNYERLLEPLKVLQLRSAPCEHPSAIPDYSKSIGDNDIDGNQPIETDTRDRVGPRSKQVSRPYVVNHEVPEGMQRPSCSNPIRGATQPEQGQGAENNNLCQLD